MRRFLAAAALAGAAACATPAAAPTAAVTPPAAVAKPAAAAPASPLTEGDVTVAAVGGMQVLVRRTPGAELVAATLAIRGGVQNVDARTAGVELLGLRTAATGGTEVLDKDAFSRKLTQLGSTVNASAAPNYSLLESKALLSAWGQTFELLADVFLRPALPASELQLQREQQLQELKHEQENPDGALGVLAQQLAFRGTPYALRPSGTEESVKALSTEAVRAYLTRLRVQSRLLLVVVGDVEPAAVLEKARAAFGALPSGEPLLPLPAPLSFMKPQLAVEARPLPTNYILATFAGPSWGAPDFAAARLASFILGQRAFLEVRTKRNLSYAPAARLDVNRPQAFGELYVTAVDPSATLPVMQGVVRELAEKPVPDKELAGYRSTFLTSFLMGAETTDAQARRLVAAQLLGGDWRLVRTLPERIRQTGPEDVQAFAQKYPRNYQVAVVGDAKKVDLSMLR